MSVNKNLDYSNKAFYWLVSIVTLIRGFYAWYLPLGDDEAYYWEWGKHLDWSYLDHPPMTAWVGRFFTSIFGDTELGVRMGPLLFSVLFLILIYRFTTKLFGSKKMGFYAALLMGVIPVFSVGGFMLLPDAPLALFWLMSLMAFHKVVTTGKNGWWYVVGLCWGLAMLSKYNAFLFPICVGLFLLLSPDHRFWFFRLHSWLGGILGLLIFSPVVIWNMQRGFPSFAYHLVERNQASSGFSLEPFQIFLVGQFIYLSPFVFIGALVVLVQLGRRALSGRDERDLYLFTMAVPYLLVFFIACSVSPTTKPHWPALGYTTLFCALPWFWQNLWKEGTWRRRLFGPIPSIGFAVLITLILLVQSIYPIIRMDPKLDLTNELYGWTRAGAEIQRTYDQLSQKAHTIVFTRRLNMASQVCFNTPDHIPAYSITPIHEQFDIWGRGSFDRLPKGSNAVYVADSWYEPGNLKKYHFKRYEALPPIEIKRGGRVVRRFYLFRCYDYLGNQRQKGNR